MKIVVHWVEMLARAMLNNAAAACARRSGGATGSRVRPTIQTVMDDGFTVRRSPLLAVLVGGCQEYRVCRHISRSQGDSTRPCQSNMQGRSCCNDHRRFIECWVPVRNSEAVTQVTREGPMRWVILLVRLFR